MEERFVSPGEELGTEEEFIPGEGTAAVGGKIIATAFGKLEVDKNHKTSVASCAAPKKIGVGSIVYGRVEEIFEPVALVSITPSKHDALRQVPLDGYAVLHASKIKNDFVKNVSEEVKRGDIIKAKVVDYRKTDCLLSTAAPDLGVIKGFCEVCRAPLPKEGRGLKCPRCGKYAVRKTSSEYSLS